MPRKFKNIDHLLKPDPIYHDKLMQKFVNNLMYSGKRSTSQRIFYRAIDGRNAMSVQICPQRRNAIQIPVPPRIYQRVSIPAIDD